MFWEYSSGTQLREWRQRSPQLERTVPKQTKITSSITVGYVHRRTLGRGTEFDTSAVLTVCQCCSIKMGSSSRLTLLCPGDLFHDSSSHRRWWWGRRPEPPDSTDDCPTYSKGLWSVFGRTTKRDPKTYEDHDDRH